MTSKEAETIKALQDALALKDQEIARLKHELETMQHRAWVNEACGDDHWTN